MSQQPDNEIFVKLAAGWDHACGIRADGTMYCWGRNDFLQTVTPKASPIVLFDGQCYLRRSGETNCPDELPRGQNETYQESHWHKCELDVYGGVSCGQRWHGVSKWNYTGQSDGAAGPFLRLSIAPYHSCGLKHDGKIVCWGSNSHGKGELPEDAVFVDVSALKNATCGIDDVGTLHCVGDVLEDDVAYLNESSLLQFLPGDAKHCALAVDGEVRCLPQGYGEQYNYEEIFTSTYEDFISNGGLLCGLRDGVIAWCGANDWKSSWSYGRFGSQSRVWAWKSLLSGSWSGLNAAVPPDVSVDAIIHQKFGFYSDTTPSEVCGLLDSGGVLCHTPQQYYPGDVHPPVYSKSYANTFRLLY